MGLLRRNKKDDFKTIEPIEAEVKDAIVEKDIDNKTLYTPKRKWKHIPGTEYFTDGNLASLSELVEALANE